MSEFALRFVLANLAVGAAVLVVLALRAPVRAMFGARLTYAMWLLVPLAGLASLLPPRVEQIVNIVRPNPELRGEWAGAVPWEPALDMPGQDGAAPELPALAPPQFTGTAGVTRETAGFEIPNPIVLGLIAWLAGVIGMAAWQLRRQSRFVSDAKAGFAGPAVVGVFKPRIVTPSDFETTFDASEREMILTHERIHIEGNDARINALAALAGCICWFNPLVHLGAYFMRIDQELACDASVVTRHPESRSLYASALLKAQLARAPLPLGCHWPSRSEHPLLQRVAMLGRAEPGRGRRIAGVALLGLLAAASGVAAWAALPPERRVVERDITEALAAQDAPAPQDASVQEPLRILALRHALLEIRTPSGAMMVRRFFEPGETYTPRVGNGWIVSAEDGGAFEWRAGDKALGPLAPSGAANSIPVDGVIPGLQHIKLQAPPQQGRDAPVNPNAPAPSASDLQAVRDLRVKLEQADAKLADLHKRYGEQHPEVQEAIRQRDAADRQLREQMKRIAEQPQKIPAGFDPNDLVYLRGTVEKIDFADTTYTAYVRARSIAAGPSAPAKIDDHLWKLSPINYWGDRDRVSKDILRELVNVTGYRSVAKACGPECQVHVSTMIKCSVQPTFAPGCVNELGRQDAYLQQTPPAPAGKPLVINGPPGGFGPIDPMTIRGRVERIDFGDTKYTVFVRASSASSFGGFADKADSSLFELSPTPYWGDRDAINAELKGKNVVVQGSRASTPCEAACKVNVFTLKVAQPTALPPITQTPGFSSTDVVVNYDASAGTMIQGVVQRIEFGERTFDAYVQLRAALGVPGELFQVRSEYRFPRADIEKQLKGKTVYIAGWPAKQQPDMTCSSPCGLYATDIRLGSGDIISPAGVQLVSKATSAAPGPRKCFKDYNSAPSRGILRCTIDDGRGAPVVDTRSFEPGERYDVDAPVTIDGRIVRADKAGYWVEVNAFEPANTPGAEAGKTWYVENDTLDKASYIGQHITARGLNAKDTSCKPECRMFSLGYSIN